MWIVQHNDGRISHVHHKGEARFWAWLSMDMIVCNVYKVGGSMMCLSPFDII